MKYSRPVYYLPLMIILLTFIFLVSRAIAMDALDQKIGQMIMVSYSPDTAFEDTLHYDLEHRNLGGVILYRFHLNDPVQIGELTSELQEKADTPPFIATDQEGGFVARLDETNGFAETYTAYHLGTVIDKEDSTRHQAQMMAQWLYDSGINTNLAPVVDVNVNPSSPAIGYLDRSFSSQPHKVFDHAQWFISEFEKLNVTTALKHFPGHGSAEQDSHLGFTDITSTWTDSELVPYRELISNGYSGMVMPGHLYNADLDPVYPASLSESIITDLLRDSLGFEGVVISDAMFMRAITNNYSFEEAIVLAVNAGTDVLLYTSNEYNGRSLVAEVIRIIRQHIDTGVIAQARIEASYQRIMALKEKFTGISPLARRIVPDHFSLRIYPNPFNISTHIQIDMNKAGPVSFSVYDISGRQLHLKRFAWLSEGKHIIPFDASTLASGVYITKCKAAGTIRFEKMT
ncbi:MAG: glycoside hydrolase family 3 N-terminal domain-containing protein, partial [candidate division KSB1 bacterium]|nr:glycoside hydrolase family 3 N-terminal domain-containing protein [candidate division KSB1 bacterium]